MSQEKEVRESKYISYLLRHHPEKGNLTLDEHGYADVSKLIYAVCAKFPDFNEEELDAVVKHNDKQRYAYDENKKCIRARQGHSVTVDVELKPTLVQSYLYHGTAKKSLDAIFREGLKPMGRLYVHLSSDYGTAIRVGSRHGTPVVLLVDAMRMQKDGYEFYLSENGIWLTKTVPSQYLEVL